MPYKNQAVHAALQNSEHDNLTGLLTHHAFRNYLHHELAEGNLVSSDSPIYAILFFNIENFKHYNQSYGFAEGDTLIKHVAASIERAFPTSVIARFSADQFVLLTEESEVTDGTLSVRHEFRREHKDSSIWLRAGYYLIGPDDHDAGVACDRAKIACDDLRGRRDTFIRKYDNDLQHRITWRRYVLDHFEEALEKNWIQAWCQPIVRVATGETCDVEALARWIDPEEGVVPPLEFVPVLEEARVIHLMDLHVIRDVCRTCHELADQGKQYIPISFNLSRLDFELCDIVSEVTSIIDEYEIPHSMVSVEVTESALTGNAEFLKGEIDRFRAAGIEVWMDDFGSGYSSLNVLKDYTFDLIKIDIDFLHGLEHTEQARIMLAKVIDMVKELGIKTLVEGVETQDHYDYLRTLGCGHVQGWLFGKASPMPDSVEAVTNETHPPVELLLKRGFYEDVGRINLMRPDPKLSQDGHYLPGDTPAAIVRRRNGVYEYLNTNVLFEQFLHEIGIDSIQQSMEEVNARRNDRSKRIVELIESCAADDDWHRYTMTGYEKMMAVRMRTISRLEEFDALALLCVVDEIIEPS